ncbi:hypothetical protein EVAR_23431_1 [Eumeta japonica]|uniref:Uncharacterized protein n=1 Tax=Eumeta variegata TaxID=151549 RepID=A0A4C1UJP5_EUMVA|nr:hypothetical protein EVAR_23431_1 [Eumeta japonica]
MDFCPPCASHGQKYKKKDVALRLYGSACFPSSFALQRLACQHLSQIGSKCVCDQLGDEVKSSHDKKRTQEVVPNDDAIAAEALPAPPRGFVKRASLKDEIGRLSMPAVGRPTPVDLSGSIPRSESRDVSSTRLDAHPMERLTASTGILAREAKGEL